MVLEERTSGSARTEVGEPEVSEEMAFSVARLGTMGLRRGAQDARRAAWVGLTCLETEVLSRPLDVDAEASVLQASFVLARKEAHLAGEVEGDPYLAFRS